MPSTISFVRDNGFGGPHRLSVGLLRILCLRLFAGSGNGHPLGRRRPYSGGRDQILADLYRSDMGTVAGDWLAMN